jgi:hypothetical protein
MVVAAALMFCAASASAQGLQPNGFKMGDGRLHIFGEIDGRFDSLVGYFTQPGVPSPEIIVTPRAGLTFGLESPSSSVKFGANAEYLIFTGLLTGGSSSRLSRLQALATLETAFNKDGVVEVDISDSLTRSDRTQNPSAGIGVISLFNALSLALPIRPGGRALEITPRVTWGVEFFEPLLVGQSSCPAGDITCDPTRVSDMNYSNLNFALGARYRFLPKTAALLDANFDYRTYWNPASANQPANILRGRAGIAGLITPRFSITLLAGAAYDFGSTQRAAPIGLAELMYLVGESVSVAVGYTRDMLPVPAFGTYADDRGYLNARVGLLGERLNLNGTFAVDYFTFFAPMGAVSNRADLLVSGNFGPSFVVTSWFVISAGYGIGFRTSSLTTQTGINFVRHEANLRLTFRY